MAGDEILSIFGRNEKLDGENAVHGLFRARVARAKHLDELDVLRLCVNRFICSGFVLYGYRQCVQQRPVLPSRLLEIVNLLQVNEEEELLDQFNRFLLDTSISMVTKVQKGDSSAQKRRSSLQKPASKSHVSFSTLAVDFYKITTHLSECKHLRSVLSGHERRVK